MVLRYSGEERGRSSRNVLVKLNCESRQRGKYVQCMKRCFPFVT